MEGIEDSLQLLTVNGGFTEGSFNVNSKQELKQIEGSFLAINCEMYMCTCRKDSGKN